LQKPLSTRKLKRLRRYCSSQEWVRESDWLQKSKYGYLWITLAFFALSLVGHWLFGWFAYVNEQQTHAAPVEVSDYTIQMLRDTLENWQSEFLQLIWQFAGLAILLYVGSPQSREGDERKEAKTRCNPRSGG
jgi:hypothetical protein